jgi:hypothetical protein
MSSGGTLPQFSATTFITDGGMETTLIFHQGRDLPSFAAFTLLQGARLGYTPQAVDDANQGRSIWLTEFAPSTTRRRSSSAAVSVREGTATRPARSRFSPRGQSTSSALPR